MKRSKWFFCLLCGALSGVMLVASFNVLTDPFGLFGDRALNWYGYNMTNNPKLAKFAYLDKGDNYKNYNGYILGSSKASSLSPTQLNAYYDGASFYNLMTYGANFAHMEKYLYYVVDHYDAEHIVLSLGMSERLEYGYETDDVKQRLHAKVAGDPLVPFYAKFLLLNPRYGMDKLRLFGAGEKERAPTIVDVFLPETGVYNKSERDQENIVNIYDYTASVGDGTFLTEAVQAELIDFALCVAAAGRMQRYCEARGVTFTIISTPNHDLEIQMYDKDTMIDYWAALAEETQGFWNFSGYSDISLDPRFFYDVIHFRNNAGDMTLGKVYGDEQNVYYPARNFGHYFTPENARALAAMLLDPAAGAAQAGFEVSRAHAALPVPVPILLYHHLLPEPAPPGQDLAAVGGGDFEAHMRALKDAGFTTLFTQDLIDYVSGQSDLPEKPILITFDDGYASNYEIAFPILKELGMKATISIIGWSVGRDTMMNGIDPIIPHFTWEQAKEMADSGWIDIQSHSYDLHWADAAQSRRAGALIMEGETTAAYEQALEADHELFVAAMDSHGLLEPVAFFYPYGYADVLADTILREQGYRATFLTGEQISPVTRGDARSLYGLYRLSVDAGMSADEVLALIAE